MKDSGIFSRTERMLGAEALTTLGGSTIIIFGLGGVGSYAAEALARCGVGRFVIVDGDAVDPSNINRQLIALTSTVGLAKTEAAKERMLLINPGAEITAVNMFVNADNIPEVIDIGCAADYVIDAVDDIPAKLAIIERCKELGLRVISSMGAGNKLRPERFMIADIYGTRVCPLAKVMRKRLRERGVGSLTVCYSDEEPLKRHTEGSEYEGERPPIGSISFVPAAAGLVIAGHVVRDMLDIQ